MRSLFPPEPVQLAEEVWHIPQWLSWRRQVGLADKVREWCQSPAGVSRPMMPNGTSMSVEMVGLGWHWYPYQYSRTLQNTTGEPVKPFPNELGLLADEALGATYGPHRKSKADCAIINRYADGAKMGMHQDLEEASGEPVISLSLGASCVFRFGNSQTRNKPWTDLTLRSGDLFVFGGSDRYAFHGVTRVLADGPPLTMAGERFNVTLRCVGGV